MDKQIIEIQITWAQRRFLGLVDKETAVIESRREVYEYLLTIGALEAAMVWRWKLAFGH